MLRTLVVARVERVSAGIRRVVLTGAELGAFERDGRAVAAVRSPAFDDVVVLCLPDPETGETALPVPAEGGGLRPPARGVLVAREYTVRGLAGGEMSVDLVEHADGPTMRWLATVQPGDEVVVVAPRVSRDLPRADRLLALGDATALPALARLLESWPPAVVGAVAISLPAGVEAPRLARPQGVSVEVLSGAPGDPGPLLRSLASRVLPTDFAWVAGEAGLVGEVRRQLVAGGLEPDRIQFTGYWRLGGAL